VAAAQRVDVQPLEELARHGDDADPQPQVVIRKPDSSTERRGIAPPLSFWAYIVPVAAFLIGTTDGRGRPEEASMADEKKPADEQNADAAIRAVKVITVGRASRRASLPERASAQRSGRLGLRPDHVLDCTDQRLVMVGFFDDVLNLRRFADTFRPVYPFYPA
jgi:hypothetical protein